MSPVTHFLASWALAESSTLDRRDRLAICLAGVAPDLDGLGVVVDLANRALGRPDSLWFATYHHFLFHGLFGAALAVVIAASLGIRRWKPCLLVFLSVHLHLACDLIGSHGPMPDEIWAIQYLAPFSRACTFSWSHQWRLNAWPNMAITAALLAWALARAVNRGDSPVSVVNSRWDTVIVATLRHRWRLVRIWFARMSGPKGIP